VKKPIKDAVKAERLSFPNDEKVHPWLSLLLDAYYIVDKGVFKAIEAEKKRGKKLACRKACSSCCSTHKDVPVYPLELVGISWYATEKISGGEREVLKERLKNHHEKGPCPLLVDGICSVHPMRPIACRQFNVFNNPCSDGEDPYYSRRDDVLQPVKKYVDQAFFIMFPFYGIEKESERVKAVENGTMHKMVRAIQECNWKSLADKMNKFDRKTEDKPV